MNIILRAFKIIVKTIKGSLSAIMFWCAVLLWCFLALGLISPLLLKALINWVNTEDGEAFVLAKVEEYIQENSIPLRLQGIDLDLPRSVTVRGIEYTLSTGQKAQIKTAQIDFEKFLTGRLNAQGTALGYKIDLQTGFDWLGSEVALSDMRLTLPELKVTGDVNYDIVRSLMTGKASVSLKSLAPYQRFIGLGHKLSPVQANVNFSAGLLSQKGDFSLKTKSYAYEGVDFELRQIEMQGKLQGKKLDIIKLQATDKDGSPVKIDGHYDLASEKVDLRLNAEKLHVLKGQPVDTIIDAALLLKGPVSALNLSGDVRARKLTAILPEKFATSISELDIVTEDEEVQGKEQKPVRLQLNLQAPNSVFVRGWGLDAEFGGALEVTGTVDNPVLYGQLKMLRGRYEEFGKRFTIERALLRFNGPVPPSPILDIIVATKIDDVTTRIHIEGPAMKPKISFSSTPDMPEDEVFSYILFGQGKGQLSPFQIVQLTQSLARFTGRGGKTFDPIASIRDATGLDDLRVGMDDDGAATVGAGKYIADGVYLELETGAQAGKTGASVEVDLGKHWTLESKVGQDANAGAGVFWKWDY